ncbi:MAG: hypothetical protein LBF27_06780 [Sphingobacterium sp.]|nr:hypothetical protein [Sphingobacterium sp.]
MAAKKIKIKASSLVETLVSMVIILIVFGIGLLIFVNITKASRSETRKNTDEMMASWSHELETAGFGDDSTGEKLQDSIRLSYAVSTVAAYPDRLRLVIYTMHPEDNNRTDSLVRYIENRNEDGGQR